MSSVYDGVGDFFGTEKRTPLYGGAGYCQFISCCPETPDMYIPAVARISTGSRSTNETANTRLINYLLNHQHDSPFEFAWAHFKICVPIYVARQLMRHRTLSYNELSMRYTQADEKFHVPPLRLDAKTSGDETYNEQMSSRQITTQDIHDIAEESCRTSFNTYNLLLKRGVAKEVARVVLPVSTMTEIHVSGCLRNFLNFINLRTHESAQPEIAELAEAMLAHIGGWCPQITQAYIYYRIKSVKFNPLEIDILGGVGKINIDNETLAKLFHGRMTTKSLSEKRDFIKKIKTIFYTPQQTS